MTVKIGHASKDENSKIKGGSAGDQTGKEVCVRSWYEPSKKWVVLRCLDDARRELIAEAMEKACANPQIGYDQNQRDSLFNNVKDKGFDPSATTKKVETDCSALVRVCIAYAYGKDVAGNIRTIDEPQTLVGTGLFKKLTAEKYCESSDYLLRGDILCTPVSGHTAVVLDDGLLARAVSKTAQEPARLFDGALAGTYRVTANVLNVRSGAGTKANEFGDDKRVLTGITKDMEVICLGAYTVVDGTKWLYIHFVKDGITYTAFASGKYLKRSENHE